MSQQDIEERIRQSIRGTRRKRWYQHLWGKMLIVLMLLIGVFLIVFSILVVQAYRDILSGTVPVTDYVNALKQEATLDLLHNSKDPSIGLATAPITVVAFEDFQCPFCFQAQPLIKKIIAQHGSDVRFIYKDFPLNSIHPYAQSAAEAGQCAFEQGKFWQFHDEMFAHQDKLGEPYYRSVAKQIGLNITSFNECYATGKYRRQVLEDAELGRTLGVVGTPTFFINGELFAQGYSPEMDQAFEKAFVYIKSL